MKHIKPFQSHIVSLDDIIKMYVEYKSNGSKPDKELNEILNNFFNDLDVLENLEKKAEYIISKLEKLNAEYIEDYLLVHFDRLLKWKPRIDRIIHYSTHSVTSSTPIKAGEIKCEEIVPVLMREALYLDRLTGEYFEQNLDMIYPAIKIWMNYNYGETRNATNLYQISEVDDVVDEIVEDCKKLLNYKKFTSDYVPKEKRRYSGDLMINDYNLYFIL
jgi:hypothetical protein